MPLFLDIYFLIHIRYSIEVVEEKFTYNISHGVLLVVLSAGCGLLAWMHWSFIGQFVIGFK
jgi:hypothetical protein